MNALNRVSRRRLAVAPLLAALILCASHGTLAQDMLIRGAEVHTVSQQGKLANTDVLVRGGKIAAIGHALAAPAGVAVIEARGRPLTPGLFGGLSEIGVDEVPGEKATVDSGLSVGAEQLKDAQWHPEFDVTLSYNPNSVLVPVARVEGLTWTMLTPSSARGGSFVAGQGAAVLLDGRYDAVVDGSRSLFINLGGDAIKLSGGSRAAQTMLFEQAIRETRSKSPGNEHSLLGPAGREVLARYLAGGRVVLHVDRAVDIHRAIAFAKKAGMHPVITGGSEAWMVADELAAAGVPVLLDALENLPEDFDRLGSRLDNAALLHRAGVRVGFTGTGSANARKIRQLAGSAVAHGLPWDVALAGLTATPAQIFGLKASRGIIAVGQTADLVLWSGDPLELTVAADQVWMGGKPIEMRSRQLDLRDRYLARLRNNMAR